MDQKKHNILVLSSWYPNRLNPTLGNFNEKFAEAAALYNNVSAIYLVADPNLDQKFKVEVDTINNVKTYIGYFKKRNNENVLHRIIKSYKFFKYYKRVYKIARRENGKFDMVHLNILFPVGMIALLFKFMYGLKYVISENWTGYLPAHEIRQSWLIRKLSRKVARNAAVLLPVTNNLKQALIRKKMDNNNFVIVPNVTDIKHFYLPEKIEEKEKKVILHVSSLNDDHKNITGIINVIKRLSAKRNDFELKIVGDGDAVPHKNYAKSKGLLGDVVTFYGAMTPQEIGEIMRQSDMFLLFSNYENLPCVIVESFAAGLPVVSSTAGGVDEHLSKDKGLLVEPKDEDALFNSVNHVLDNLKGYDKQKLHDYAVNNFSYEKVGEKLTNIYSSIISKNTR